MKTNRKFIFTQLSAPIVCGVTILGIGFLIGKFHPINGKNLTLTDCLLLLLLFASMFLSMYFWGRILVLLGILTKEEAKGYPYSKPWEKGNLL
jgi:membrane-bound ClpP family serine protease